MPTMNISISELPDQVPGTGETLDDITRRFLGLSSRATIVDRPQFDAVYQDLNSISDSFLQLLRRQITSPTADEHEKNLASLAKHSAKIAEDIQRLTEFDYEALKSGYLLQDWFEPRDIVRNRFLSSIEALRRIPFLDNQPPDWCYLVPLRGWKERRAEMPFAALIDAVKCFPDSDYVTFTDCFDFLRGLADQRSTKQLFEIFASTLSEASKKYSDDTKARKLFFHSKRGPQRASQHEIGDARTLLCSRVVEMLRLTRGIGFLDTDEGGLVTEVVSGLWYYATGLKEEHGANLRLFIRTSVKLEQLNHFLFHQERLSDELASLEESGISNENNRRAARRIKSFMRRFEKKPYEELEAQWGRLRRGRT